MSVSVICFFNNKGGVGKTSLVYHLAWMFADLGVITLAVDLDPQANLTSAFLDDDAFEELFDKSENGVAATMHGAVRPLIEGSGDIKTPEIIRPADNLDLVAGDLLLSTFEDQLSETWPKCLSDDKRAFRVTSAFWRVMQQTAQQVESEVILVDLGPNLGAINRAALISSDYVVIPLAPDLFSLQGLRNLGPTLRRWREDWRKRLEEFSSREIRLPQGRMQPSGYIVQQHAVRLDRPVNAYARWMNRIPSEYQESVLNERRPTACRAFYRCLQPRRRCSAGPSRVRPAICLVFNRRPRAALQRGSQRSRHPDGVFRRAPSATRTPRTELARRELHQRQGRRVYVQPGAQRRRWIAAVALHRQGRGPVCNQADQQAFIQYAKQICSEASVNLPDQVASVSQKLQSLLFRLSHIVCMRDAPENGD